ncbi:Hypothetical Protein FCC1311_011452 [Hondaea fermentalgiana]|uniref:Uncharacterized protein n=1 Tax=Hondaea fermentalgiana TaxID=2315210 RepID=A0A2R5G564_9STRA|nr:Hypothetical Protein FCC1311_011452 [Hondaea fermentalgiana]|eukprot:GBG24928.1 Hypothetical Protein FCC1311_011452 [Hondaea fermentalgiana]
METVTAGAAERAQAAQGGEAMQGGGAMQGKHVQIDEEVYREVKEEDALNRLAELRLQRLEALKVDAGEEWFLTASTEALQQVVRNFDRTKEQHREEVERLQAMLDREFKQDGPDDSSVLGDCPFQETEDPQEPATNLNDDERVPSETVSRSFADGQSAHVSNPSSMVEKSSNAQISTSLRVDAATNENEEDHESDDSPPPPLELLPSVRARTTTTMSKSMGRANAIAPTTLSTTISDDDDVDALLRSDDEGSECSSLSSASFSILDD